MEYVLQGELMTLIKHEKLSEDGGREISQQFVEGLEIMHRNLLCHRDLKPEMISFSNSKYQRLTQN